jgi:lipopolysaccharide exporter
LNSFSWQLPTFFLSTYFTTTIVGYYALGMMALQFPMNLIGSAISQVFFQRAARAAFDGTLSDVVEDTFLHLVMIGIYPILLLSLIGEDIFIVLFGVQWSEAGIYVQILAIWIFFVFITSPISTLFSVLEKQRVFLLFTVLLFSSRALALILGGKSGNVIYTLIIFSLVGVLGYAAICYWILCKANANLHDISRKILLYLWYCLPNLIIVILAKWGFSLDPGLIFLIGCFSAIIYYMIVIKKEHLLDIFV